jgi:hypothetical protein
MIISWLYELLNFYSYYLLILFAHEYHWHLKSTRCHHFLNLTPVSRPEWPA